VTSVFHIACSPKGDAAHSWRIAEILLAGLPDQNPGAVISTRRLDQSPPTLADAAFAAEMMAHTTAKSAREAGALQESEWLIEELDAADILVISTPMHNFTVPAALKAWIDQVVRFGRTFQNTPMGKIGLLRDRPVYIVIASGGFFTGENPMQQDFLTPYLRAILGTIGLKDIHFVTAEAMSRGSEAVAAGEASARRQIAALLVR
jgi:FMN-dependent NADH-azoreductase